MDEIRFAGRLVAADMIDRPLAKTSCIFADIVCIDPIIRTQ